MKENTELPQIKREIKMERTERNINNSKQILWNPQIQQNRKENFET